ncbi:hypothetical protein E1181_15205 [Saccharopolyspora terrae]|jgi:hypothetical protein|uniref:Ferredoxin n=1 Tax=Saccharopolyspora terrae TaxID=2530384 RepID=A0A4R4VIG4_9PSEU|nr:hypothetical protein [Saccharopolyspora terrae]TDD05479.1 hypothetical protein E1181_15205 [Saccharopolyspora terrae]
MTAARTDVPASTTADQRLYLEGGLRPLPCATCGVRVLVKKLSPEQTSIQWTTSTGDCPEIAARIAEGEHPALVDTCPRLRATIEHALREGVLEVPEIKE